MCIVYALKSASQLSEAKHAIVIPNNSFPKLKTGVNYSKNTSAMAGKFWSSSQFQQWLLDRQDLLRERHADLQLLSEEEYSKVMIFFANFIQSLGEQLKVKQQVIATATVYLKRFYVRNSFKCVDPLLLAPTCIFLASKVEEFGVISNSRLISTCQAVVKNKYSHVYATEFPYRINHVLECEFYLLEVMDCCLVLYHAYRPLVQYVADIGQDNELLSTAWKVANDSLRTDVALLYPPHQIAIACLHIACVILGKDYKTWFAELNVDFEKILEITRIILNLYELCKNFDEKKELPQILQKVPKPKTQPSRPPSQGPDGQPATQPPQGVGQQPQQQQQQQQQPQAQQPQQQQQQQQQAQAMQQQQ